MHTLRRISAWPPPARQWPQPKGSPSPPAVTWSSGVRALTPCSPAIAGGRNAETAAAAAAAPGVCPVLAFESKEGTTTPPSVNRARRLRRASAPRDGGRRRVVGGRGVFRRAPREPSTPALRVLRDLGRRCLRCVRRILGRTIQQRSAELEAARTPSIKHDEDELEVAHALYRIYVRACRKYEGRARCLARGFCAVSRRLGGGRCSTTRAVFCITGPC